MVEEETVAPVEAEVAMEDATTSEGDHYPGTSREDVETHRPLPQSMNLSPSGENVTQASPVDLVRKTKFPAQLGAKMMSDLT